MSHRLLILAPRGRDAEVAAALFARNAIDVHVCRDIADLVATIETDAAAVMLTEEVLADPHADRLAEWIARQPAWSDLPFIVLADGLRAPRSDRALGRLQALGNTVLLERPLHAEAMLGAVRSAIKARVRQYQVRDFVTELRESERELRFTLKAGRLGSWTLDLTSYELTTSEMCRVNFGRDPDAPFSYGDLRDAVHPDDRARMREAVRTSIATGTDYDIEYCVIAPDGQLRWVLTRARTAYAPDGTPLRMSGISIDISERKRDEARIRELNETLERQVAERTDELRQFRDIVEATTSPICAFDRDYRLIAFNRAHNDEFRRVNGFETRLGDVFPDLFVAEQRPVMRALMTRALAGEAFTETVAFGRPELGQPCWEISYTPLRDATGAIIGAFHLATDISDRLQKEADLALAQEALRQSQKMEAMGSLTGGVAHDFNNLLTPIVGSLDLLQRKGLGDERERRLIAGAAQSADRAKTLVQRLLAFARRQPLQATAVELAPLVHGMAGLIASTTGPQIRVRVDAPDGLPAARVDANQLEMAILNLAVNARDAMPSGGTLCIAVSAQAVEADNAARLAPATYLKLSVSDTGSGMDEATVARAIEPFFSTKGVGKGTGLGLSMAHGLASQLGGALTISSTVGVGTEIALWLPESVEPVVAIDVGEVRGITSGSGVVLLVDDEDLVRLSTADMLSEIGYSVVEAGSAREALRLVEDGLMPNLLVTDHLMPGMSGTELAQTLKSLRPDIKALIVSGYAESEGIDPDLPRLTKPFRNAELAESLASLS